MYTFIDKCSSALHDAWLVRNGSWSASEEQKVSFNDYLRKKEKDRAIIRRFEDNR